MLRSLLYVEIKVECLRQGCLFRTVTSRLTLMTSLVLKHSKQRQRWVTQRTLALDQARRCLVSYALVLSVTLQSCESVFSLASQSLVLSVTFQSCESVFSLDCLSLILSVFSLASYSTLVSNFLIPAYMRCPASHSLVLVYTKMSCESLFSHCIPEMSCESLFSLCTHRDVL